MIGQGVDYRFIEEDHMRIRVYFVSLCVLVTLSFASDASAQQLTRDIKVISSAGARALVDQCASWAEKNKQTVAIAILDWAGNLIESHAMEGAPANAIDTALLKAKSALRWRRATSETNKLVRSGENLAPTFMRDFPQPGALPIIINGQVIGAMGVSSGQGEQCAQSAIDAVFKGQAKTTGSNQ
jgi:glc operon protein GlcG